MTLLASSESLLLAMSQVVANCVPLLDPLGVFLKPTFSYAFAMSSIMEPFCHLLKPNTPFIWNNLLQEKFMEAKVMIINAVTEGIKHFKTSCPTCLATDWCKSGLGFFFLQKWCECRETGPSCCKDRCKLVLAGGRVHNSWREQVLPNWGRTFGSSRFFTQSQTFYSWLQKSHHRCRSPPLTR